MLSCFLKLLFNKSPSLCVRNMCDWVLRETTKQAHKSKAALCDWKPVWVMRESCLRKLLLPWVPPAGEFRSSCNLSSIAWKWQTGNFVNPIREQNHRIFQQVRKWSCKYQPRLFPITTAGGKKRPWFCVIQSGQNYHTQQGWRLQRKIRKRRLGSFVQQGSCGSPSIIILEIRSTLNMSFLWSL